MPFSSGQLVGIIIVIVVLGLLSVVAYANKNEKIEFAGKIGLGLTALLLAIIIGVGILAR